MIFLNFLGVHFKKSFVPCHHMCPLPPHFTVPGIMASRVSTEIQFPISLTFPWLFPDFPRLFPDFSETLFHVEKIGSFNQKCIFLLVINVSCFFSARKEIVTIDLNFLTFESAYDAIKTN